jgi:hypothetical protein
MLIERMSAPLAKQWVMTEVKNSYEALRNNDEVVKLF